MKISGGTTFGNCATGSPAIVTSPTITMMIDRTIATIGRLMKNLDIAPLLGFNRSFGGHIWSSVHRIHERALTSLLCAFDYDPLARTKSFLNNPICANPVADFYGLDVHFIVLL